MPCTWASRSGTIWAGHDQGVNYPKGLLSWADEKGLPPLPGDPGCACRPIWGGPLPSFALLRRMVREGRTPLLNTVPSAPWEEDLSSNYFPWNI